MSGYVDLHLHYVPGVDDGVRSVGEALELLRGLRALGFDRCVATPHIRGDLFPNERAPLEAAFEAFRVAVSAEPGLPELGLGAEHFVDERLPELSAAGATRPYPGDRAILIELPPTTFPVRLLELCFRLRSRGQLVVLAHPERYAPLFDRSDPLDPLLDRGVLPMLDLMSLVGRYGRAPRRAAERMLEEGTYVAACSDAHRATDLPDVEAALARLRSLIGAQEANELLALGPRSILDGTAEP